MTTKVSEASPRKKIVTNEGKLEYILVEWQFKNINYSVQSAEEHLTEVFKMSRDSECKWMLILECKTPVDHDENIYLWLKRCSKDKGPKKVPVSFKFGYQEDNNDIVWALDDKQHSFVMGDKQSMSVPGIDKCFQDMISTTNIKIYCLMCAFYSVRSKKTEAVLQKYSDDILSIYQKERMPDQKLTCKDGTLEVHKSILTARSKVLENILTSPEDKGLSFPNINLSIMNDLISFIYSGNWDVILKEFVHTDVREYAKMLGILDLYEKFGSETITVFNRSDYELVEYTWKIKGFPLLEEAKNKQIYSPSIKGCSDYLEDIPIKLSAKIKENELIVELHCSVFEIICEICIIGANGNKWFAGYDSETFDPEVPVAFKFDLNELSEDRELFLPQNNLTILCTMCFFKDNDDSVIRKEKCIRIEDRYCPSGMEKLSKDMETLLKSRQNCDLTLVTKKRKHKVHKVILANRPSELRAKIASLDPSVNSMMARLPDRELESLLHKAYTGRDLLGM